MRKRSAALFVLAALMAGCNNRQMEDGTPGKNNAALVRQQNATVFHLDNGMEVILVENHANPMITAFTIVRVGSRNEDAATNGAAHFLEHLLFNGTTKRTQKQLYDEMDFYGGYNNASTGPDYTSYMILMPEAYIAQGMDIQADMLFNSTLPPAKFEKERGIVIEEIGKDSDSPTYQVENQFLRAFYAGTPYARPVLGTVSSISHLQRERVQRFYHTWYVPNNMTLMVIGDFRTQEMIGLVKEKYGRPGPGALPPVAKIALTPPSRRQLRQATAIGRFPAQSKFLTIGYHLPPPTVPGFQALELLTEFLGGEANSVLQTAFKKAENQSLINSIAASLNFNRDFAQLEISAELPVGAEVHRVLEVVETCIRQMANVPVSDADLQAAQVSRATNEIYTQEKLHYYGMMKAAYLAAGGYPFLQNYVRGLREVTPQQIRAAAEKYLLPQTPVMTLMAPAASADTVVATGSPNKYAQKQLANGLTAVVQENPDSPVIGLHLLLKNRAAGEGRERWGMTEILQRTLFASGTASHPGAEFARAVDAIGAELKLHDNPWIPYDDYYNTPEYAYVRLKVVDTYFGQGLDLLAGLVRGARLQETAFREARKQALAQCRRAAGSTPAVAMRLFYDNLFAPNPGYGWVQGDTARLGRISFADIETFYGKLYNPANLILTVSGNLPAEEVLQQIEARFDGAWGEAGWQPEVPEPRLAAFGRTVRAKIGKKQSYIYLANTFQIDTAAAPALAVLMSIFSDRIAFQLREREGLAYSIGATAEKRGDARWYRIRMGTRPANIDRAIRGLKAEIRRMRAASFSEKEVRKTINAMLGRGGMRRLDRVGRAYYISMHVFDGGAPEDDERSFEKLKRVQAGDVRRLAPRVFARDDHLIVVAE